MRIVILSRGMPAASSVASSGGRISSLGTGRVMSQIDDAGVAAAAGQLGQRRRAVGSGQHPLDGRQRIGQRRRVLVGSACAPRVRRAARRRVRCEHIPVVRAWQAGVAARRKPAKLLLLGFFFLASGFLASAAAAAGGSGGTLGAFLFLLLLFLLHRQLEDPHLGQAQGLSPSFQRSLCVSWANRSARDSTLRLRTSPRRIRRLLSIVMARSSYAATC